MCDERGIRTTMSRRFIRIYDREMCETMAACGKGALNKTVPNLASRKKAVVRSILRGLEADASVVKSSGTLTFGTISTELALQLRVMYRMLGISTHMRLVVNHGGLGKNPIWRITPRVKNRGTVVKVKAISAVEPGPVWDVMTEDGYIYLPETDVVVHNCDDISIFAVSRLLNMARRGELVYLGVQPWGQHCNIGLLSVPWFDMGTRKTGGHNVAVLKYVDHDSGEDRWGHMSNWYSGRIAWGFKSLEDVVRIVCGGKKSLGWALADLKLKRWVYGRGSKI